VGVGGAKATRKFDDVSNWQSAQSIHHKVRLGSQPVFERNDLGNDVLDEVRKIGCIKPQQGRAHRFRKLFDFGFFVGHVHLRPATHSTLSTTAQSGLR